MGLCELCMITYYVAAKVSQSLRTKPCANTTPLCTALAYAHRVTVKHLNPHRFGLAQSVACPPLAW